MGNFTTRNDAADAVVAAIEATGVVGNARLEYDVDQIVDAVFETNPELGYVQAVDIADFWEIVGRSARDD